MHFSGVPPALLSYFLQYWVPTSSMVANSAHGSVVTVAPAPVAVGGGSVQVRYSSSFSSFSLISSQVNPA